MAFAHEQPWATPASPEADDAVDLYAQARRRRNFRRGGGLTAALLAITLSLTASVVRSKGGGEDGNKHNGAGGGLAPAVVPTDRAPSPLESLGASPSQDGAAMGGEAGGRQDGATPPAAYGSGEGTKCTGLTVTRKGGTMTVNPTVERGGNPDPSRYFTVVDFVDGAPGESGKTKTYASKGLDTNVDVPVPGDLNWQRHMALVSVVHYPDGVSIPDSTEAHALGRGFSGRVPMACGNAVTTLLLQGGVSTVPQG